MSDNEKLGIAAFIKLQSELRNVKTDSTNPHLKSRYASLAAITDGVRDALVSNRFAIIQTTDIENGKMVLLTNLIHESGWSANGRYLLNPVKEDPQGLGSALTYARRYAVMAILGIAPDDDDDGHSHSTHQGVATRNGSAPKATDSAKPLQQIAKERAASSARPIESTVQKVLSSFAPLRGGKAGDYTITFGKFKDTKLGQHSPKEILHYLDYIKSKDDGNMKPFVREFIAASEAYIESAMEEEKANVHSDEVPF